MDNFSKQKQDILSKKDKSSIGDVDEKIAKLCEKINKTGDYYTTSSCSGRTILIVDEDEKKPDLFMKVEHDLITFNQLKKDLLEISNKTKENIKFKQEPCILHVACRSLEDAKRIYNKGKLAGWKKSGIIALGNEKGKRIVVELNSTEKLEFPIIENAKNFSLKNFGSTKSNLVHLHRNQQDFVGGKILVDDDFLKIIIKKSNENMKKSWKKIEKLEKLI